MILNNKSDGTTTNFGKTKSFSINANKKMFEILSSKLYSNPIAAIVRELSTNAIDSHIAAKTTQTFDVHLPTAIEPWFAVQDYGVGLSQEEVLEIFTVYGESTKDQSNDFNGALGLGSKSPFGYTEQFTVVSVQNGKKDSYICYLNNGFPDLNHSASEDTTEPNGVTVLVPVAEADYRKFTEAAIRIYSFFTTPPNITNAKLDLYTFSNIGKNARTVEISSKHSPAQQPGFNSYNQRNSYDAVPLAYVVQSNVAYPLSVQEVFDILSASSQNGKTESAMQILKIITSKMNETNYRRSGGHSALVFDVPNGSVSFVPSREELQYDAETKAALCDIVIKFADTYIDDALSMITNMSVRDFANSHADVFTHLVYYDKRVAKLVLDRVKKKYKNTSISLPTKNTLHFVFDIAKEKAKGTYQECAYDTHSDDFPSYDLLQRQMNPEETAAFTTTPIDEKAQKDLLKIKEAAEKKSKEKPRNVCIYTASDRKSQHYYNHNRGAPNMMSYNFTVALHPSDSINHYNFFPLTNDQEHILIVIDTLLEGAKLHSVLTRNNFESIKEFQSKHITVIERGYLEELKKSEFFNVEILPKFTATVSQEDFYEMVRVARQRLADAEKEARRLKRAEARARRAALPAQARQLITCYKILSTQVAWGRNGGLTRVEDATEARGKVAVISSSKNKYTEFWDIGSPLDRKHSFAWQKISNLVSVTGDVYVFTEHSYAKMLKQDPTFAVKTIKEVEKELVDKFDLANADNASRFFLWQRFIHGKNTLVDVLSALKGTKAYDLIKSLDNKNTRKEYEEFNSIAGTLKVDTNYNGVYRLLSLIPEHTVRRTKDFADLVKVLEESSTNVVTNTQPGEVNE